MKKVILPSLAVTALMAMSFTKSGNNSVKLVKTSTGYELTNAGRLSYEDLNTMKENTIIGAKNVVIFKTKAVTSQVQETLVKSEGQDPTTTQTELLNNILAKYGN